MVKIPLYTRIQQIQPKLHGLAAGMTLGIGSVVLSQGCPLVGQCSACAACAPRLPLLALPLVLDGVAMLSAKVMEKKARTKAEEG